jgi:hypothetical protein
LTLLARLKFNPVGKFWTFETNRREPQKYCQETFAEKNGRKWECNDCTAKIKAMSALAFLQFP